MLFTKYFHANFNIAASCSISIKVVETDAEVQLTQIFHKILHNNAYMP
jgi:hypothetical protein